MFSLLSSYLTKILAVAALGASVTALVLWLQVGSLSERNTLLEADIQSYKTQVSTLKGDQELKDKILLQRDKDQEVGRREMNKLKAELKRLTNESNDKCMGSSIPDTIRQRLQSLSN